jgi:hypothetical protein
MKFGPRTSTRQTIEIVIAVITKNVKCRIEISPQNAYQVAHARFSVAESPLIHMGPECPNIQSPLNCLIHRVN